MERTLADYEVGLAECEPAGEFVNDQRAVFTLVHCAESRDQAIESRAGEAALWFMNAAPEVFRVPRASWVDLLRGAVGRGAASGPLLDAPEAPPTQEELDDPIRGLMKQVGRQPRHLQQHRGLPGLLRIDREVLEQGLEALESLLQSTGEDQVRAQAAQVGLEGRVAGVELGGVGPALGGLVELAGYGVQLAALHQGLDGVGPQLEGQVPEARGGGGVGGLEGARVQAAPDIAAEAGLRRSLEQLRAGVVGLWSITSAKHQIADGGFTTSIETEKPKSEVS